MTPIRGPARALGALACATLLFLPVALRAQDSAATLTVRVRADTAPVPGATVRVGRAAGRTDASGMATVRAPVGEQRVIVTRLGFDPETVMVALRAAQDTTIDVSLREQSAELEGVTVSATRTERRIEEEPIRVEVVGEEEVEEKLLMTPGDIAMLLNETSGLRVQVTSPSLGGAVVRTQGLSGRYTQILSDGLPLYGGQAGALGLLQIPPMDLGRVEVLKGSASALYGASALGGVINLVSRRPGEEGERELLLNQTSRGGSDGVLWLSGPVLGNERVGYTFLGGAHGQRRSDLDADGWADIPGYERWVGRPRLFWNDGEGRSMLLTIGGTHERRDGGTIGTAVAPDGAPYREALDTRRLDIGGVGRVLVAGHTLVAVRGSAMEQRHDHRFGPVAETDRHRTGFLETTASRATVRGTYVVGAAIQREDYRARDVPETSYRFTIPSAFAQADVTPVGWLSLAASARVDVHSAYGTSVNPLVSALVRAPGAVTVRLALGTGTQAPTPFTETTEVTGLTPLQRFDPDALRAERATSASADIGRRFGALEVNATAFGSEVRHPLQLVAVEDGAGAPQLELVNAPAPIRTRGGELLARWTAEPLHVTASYSYLRSTEWSPDGTGRRDVPLTPRHSAGVVAAYEREGQTRVGLELYYTGRQTLDDNPFRSESRPYVVVGMLAEQRFGRWRVFVNGENLGDVRQTRYDPLVRPTRGLGGRWTTDAWTLLEGRVVNGGIRVEL